MLSILVDYGIRSTILLALTGAAVMLLRGRSAAWRHLLWLAGLIALLALPGAKLLAPQWNAPALAQRLLAAPIRTIITVTAHPPLSRQPSIDWLLIAWIGGAAFFLIRATRAQVLASRLARRAKPGPDGTRISNETDVPIVCGLLRPVVILPSDSVSWPAERLESVLRHERMHIARRDTIAQAVAQVACAFYWPQPLAWLAASELRNACEQACDDGVLSQGTKPSAYAQHLMEIARALQQPASAAFEGGIAMTRTNQLEQRISSLLNSKRDRRQAGASFTAVVAAMAVTVVIALAAFHTPLFAQSGKLAGVVRDASGAVIPRARIDVRSASGAAARGESVVHEIVYSNAIGEFSLDVADGSYDISIAAQGFAKQDHQGVLFANRNAKRMDMTLAVGAIQERIQVQSGMDHGLDHGMDQKMQAERAAIERTNRAAESNSLPPQRIRVGGNVQAANLIRKVTPLYPTTAKLDRVEGTVIIKVVIGKDGTILSLEQINKLVDTRLAEAALDAVKQWQYKPTLLNGEPIEVVTEIEVNFTLTR